MSVPKLPSSLLGIFGDNRRIKSEENEKNKKIGKINFKRTVIGPMGALLSSSAK
jgi:hypothetical protein